MGFKSVMGKIGKVALKAAPIAASVIPGMGAVGALAKMGKVGSILGKAGTIAGAVSPVLGQAAGARADARQAEGRDQMQRDVINQNADVANQGLPDSRMRTMARAAYGMNGPVSVNMIKPGEGMQGKTTQFTGGANMALDPRYAQLASKTMDDTLQSQLTGNDQVRGATPEAPTSGIDKALAAGAFGTAMGGALGSLRKPKPTTGGAPGVMMPRAPGILKNVQF